MSLVLCPECNKPAIITQTTIYFHHCYGVNKECNTFEFKKRIKEKENEIRVKN